jgi:hypothetical protein
MQGTEALSKYCITASQAELETPMQQIKSSIHPLANGTTMEE